MRKKSTYSENLRLTVDNSPEKTFLLDLGKILDKSFDTKLKIINEINEIIITRHYFILGVVLGVVGGFVSDGFSSLIKLALKNDSYLWYAFEAIIGSAILLYIVYDIKRYMRPLELTREHLKETLRKESVIRDRSQK